MKNFNFFILLFLFLGAILLPESVDAKKIDRDRVVANPIDLNYRFQIESPSRREAADPVIEMFKGKYYLFASKSEGYWSSPDLIEWTYIPTKTIPTIEDYAPIIIPMDDALYFMASSTKSRIFKKQ